MTTPADPFRQVDILAATYAEKYQAFTTKGIPPIPVAVMLGTELAMFGGLIAAMGTGDQDSTEGGEPPFCTLGPVCVNGPGQPLHVLQPDCRFAFGAGSTDGS